MHALRANAVQLLEKCQKQIVARCEMCAFVDDRSDEDVAYSLPQGRCLGAVQHHRVSPGELSTPCLGHGYSKVLRNDLWMDSSSVPRGFDTER